MDPNVIMTPYGVIHVDASELNRSGPDKIADLQISLDNKIILLRKPDKAGTDPTDYQPISLLSSLGKIAEQ